jgi:hypothetical protein
MSDKHSIWRFKGINPFEEHYCQSCISNDEKYVKMNKICPLGSDVDRFIWQCPVCKTIKADWVEK